MRNLKRALSLALATVMTLGLMVVGTGAVGYQDVDRSDNQEAIEVLQAVGIMTGVTDDEFNPDGLVTRNQMAVIMSQLLNLDYNYYRGINAFTDVPAWAAPYVAACVAEGVTAGIGDGLYGGEYNVTAAQAALMLMKALGYFQYQGDFNPDWQVATVRQASYINLFSGVDANAEQALTRGQVAQMVLNALKADMVYFTGTVGTELTLPDGTKYTAGYVSEYTARTSSDRQYNTLIDDTSDIAGNDRYIIQLGEELYDGDLRQSASEDAFMRPSTTWRYDNETIGTYPDDADVTYTKGVKIGDIYNDLGLDKGIDDSDVTYYVDGAEETWSQDIVRGKSVKTGGNGTLTEVYYDAADGTVLIVATNTYVAKVSAVYDETSTRDAYVTLNISDYFTAPAGFQNDFETDEFSKDDIVYYTYSRKDGENCIQSMGLAEAVTGTMSRFTTEGSVTVDGEKYDADATSVSKIVDYMASVDRNSDVTVYLDEYGYVLYVDADTEASYAVVLEYNKSAGDWNDTAKAKLLFTDGTTESVEVELEKVFKNDGSDDALTAALNGDFFSGNNADAQLSKYDIVSYTVDSDDVYHLNLVADAKTTDVANGTVMIGDGKNVVSLRNSNNVNIHGTPYIISDRVDGKTIFLIADTSKSKTTYSVYEGFANVPTIEAGASGNGFVAAYAEDGANKPATVVFIQRTANMKMASDNEDVIYIKGVSSHKDVAPFTGRSYTSDLGYFYEYDAYVNGEETTIMSEKAITTDTLVYGPHYTTKGIMTDLNDAEAYVNAIQTSDTDMTYYGTAAGGTDSVVNDVVELGGTHYAYTSDVNVYYINIDGDLFVRDITEIGYDEDDIVFLRTNNKGLLTDVYIKAFDETESVDPDEEGAGLGKVSAGIDGVIEIDTTSDPDDDDALLRAEVKAQKDGVYQVDGVKPKDAGNATDEDILYFKVTNTEDGAGFILNIRDKDGKLVYTENGNNDYAVGPVMCYYGFAAGTKGYENPGIGTGAKGDLSAGTYTYTFSCGNSSITGTFTIGA